MNKSAKQMFEELGYKRIYIDKKHPIITYHTKNKIRAPHSYITFDGFFKEIRINCFVSDYTYKNLLKAIEKQKEELGWDNEENS